jgi:hypothetical protein
MVILVALAGLIVPVIGSYGRDSRQIATRENLLRLQDLLANQYKGDMGELPRPNMAVETTRKNHPQLRYLFINPDTLDVTPAPGATMLSGRFWRGPYTFHQGARYRDSNSKPPLDASFTNNGAYGLGDDPTTGFGGDPTILDAWANPIVIQEPYEQGGTQFSPSATDKTYTRLVSAGPDGIIQTPENVNMPTKAQRGDDVIIFLYRNDLYGDAGPTVGQ